MSSINGNDLTMMGDGGRSTMEPPTARRLHLMTRELEKDEGSGNSFDVDGAVISRIQIMMEIGTELNRCIAEGTVQNSDGKPVDPSVIKRESAILSEDFIKVKDLVEKRFEGKDVVGDSNMTTTGHYSLSLANTIKDLSAIAAGFKKSAQ